MTRLSFIVDLAVALTEAGINTVKEDHSITGAGVLFHLWREAVYIQSGKMSVSYRYEDILAVGVPPINGARKSIMVHRHDGYLNIDFEEVLK